MFVCRIKDYDFELVSLLKSSFLSVTDRNFKHDYLQFSVTTGDYISFPDTKLIFNI